MVQPLPSPLSLPDLWADFAARSWRRAPAVLPWPVADPLGDEATLFAGLLQLREVKRRARGEVVVRIARGLRFLDDIDPFLPTPADGSLAQYYLRVRDQFGGASFGLQVNQVQSFSVALWERSIDFLEGAYDFLGMPAGGANLDFFFGDYDDSPFGMHKDMQDVFTFVLRGRKRMLCWPFEELAARGGVTDHYRLAGHNGLRVRREEARSTAIVLDAAPGQLMYFPTEHWHVSEAVGDGPVATLAMGVTPAVEPFRHVRRAFARYREDHAAHELVLDASPEVSAEDLFAGVRKTVDTATSAVLGGPVFERHLDAEILEWVTAYGFERRPDLGPPCALADDDVVAAAGRRAIACVAGAGDTVLWSAAGRSFPAPAIPALLRLLEVLRDVRPTAVGVLLDRVAGDDATARARLRRILEVLVRCHALRRR